MSAGAAHPDVTYAHVAFTNDGKPVLIMPQEQQNAVLTGLDTRRINIETTLTLCDKIKSSFGPRGMDKMIVDQDGRLTITNDGATFMKSIDIDNESVKMMVELSQAQDEDIGDGTTGVVLFTGALLRQSLELLSKEFSPRGVMNGFEYATNYVIKYLTSISENIYGCNEPKNPSESQTLLAAVKTCLSSKLVTHHKEMFAKLAIDAVYAIADIERKDADFEQIKILKRVGSTLEKSRLVKGIVLEKTFSHTDMPSTLEDAKIALLTCPFEPPKLKTKHKLELLDADGYRDLQNYEIERFNDMIKQIKDSGANLAMCQWGFDDEANHMLSREGLHAVRWLGGEDVELVSIATDAKIVPMFNLLDSNKLGTCKRISTIKLDEEGEESFLFLEGCPVNKTVTVILHGSNQQIVDEVERSFNDAICVARNLIFDGQAIYGGGSAEMRSFLSLENHIEELSAKNTHSVEQIVCLKAYSKALLDIPQILAENGVGSGADNALENVSQVLANLRKCNNCEWIGIDAIGNGENDMKKANVIEGLKQKCQQLSLANELVRQMIKIDSIRNVSYS